MKKKFLVVCIILLLILISFFIFWQAKSMNLTKDWETLNDTTNGITFKYPKVDWSNLVVVPNSFPVYLKNDATMDDYYSIEIYYVENSSLDDQLMQDATIRQTTGMIAKKNVTVGGQPAVQVTGMSSIEINKQEYVATLIKHRNGVIKVILLYKSHLDTYNQILSTFKFTKI